MRIEHGNGGWVRVTSAQQPGPLYLRYATDIRPVLTEMYLDADGSEIAPAFLRSIDLSGLTALIARGNGERMDSSSRRAGPDMSRLASTFSTTWGSGSYAGRHCEACGGPVKGIQAAPNGERALTDWTALGWFAQVRGSGIPQAPRGSKPSAEPESAAPAPVAPPDGLTDAFLTTVADNYLWAVRQRRRPAPMIAQQTNSSVRTVHAWIRKARARGILPPASQGRVS